MKKLLIGLSLLAISLVGTNAFAWHGIDDYTTLMLHFNGEDGATNFVDASFNGYAVTANGDAQIDTAQKKFGTGSGQFDGSGDYLSLADDTDWYFGIGDFTIDSWVRFSNLTGIQFLCAQYVDDKNYWGVFKRPDHRLAFDFFSGGAGKGSYYTTDLPALSVNTWYHIAVVRNGATPLLFINGASKALNQNDAFSTNDVGDIASSLYLGDIGNISATHYYFNGWMDEFRISKGIARWTTNFTPPTSEYDVHTTPEPATLSLLGLGLVGLVLRRKRYQKKAVGDV